MNWSLQCEAMRWFVLTLMLGATVGSLDAQAPFKTPYSLDDMRKEAVVETSLGTFVLQLLPDAAPNHVGLFMKIARDGGFAGTAFHRVVKFAVIQGGDPFTRDAARVADWGQGGLNQVSRELNAEKHTAGSVSAVADPSRADSAGSQFFVAVTDQPALDGQYTVFARVVDGLEIVQQISAVDTDADGRPRARVDVKSVTIRDTPVEPFVKDSPAALGRYRAIIETDLGTLELEMLPDKAPETVRQFLRVAHAGIYDNTLVHRVAAGFVVQTGAINFRQTPLTAVTNATRAHAVPRIHRDAQRIRHRLDGAWRGSGERDDVVLHLHRAVPDARRQVHGVRAGRRWCGDVGPNRECAGGRRDTVETGARDEGEDRAAMTRHRVS